MVAVPLKDGVSADEFRRAAAASKDANQVRRLLALAAVCDGMSRARAAEIGGMDRQTLRDWVHAYNAHGFSGLINDTSPGRPSKLAPEQKLEIKALVTKGPDIDTDGVVRWRRVDLVRVAEQKFGIKVDADTMGRILHELGLSHISARPKHPKQKDGAIEGFKKNSKIPLRRF